MSGIAESLVRHIETMLEKRPLTKGEFRPIERMPSHSISLQKESDDPQYLFAIAIKNGQKVYVYQTKKSAG